MLDRLEAVMPVQMGSWTLGTSCSSHNQGDFCLLLLLEEFPGFGMYRETTGILQFFHVWLNDRTYPGGCLSLRVSVHIIW